MASVAEHPTTWTAAAILAERLRRGWTQAELAHKLGLHQSTVSLIERGLSPVRAQTNLLLCRVFRYQP